MAYINGKKVLFGGDVYVVDTTVDQDYNPESENAQSGIAVKEAISNKPTLYSGEELERSMLTKPNQQHIEITVDNSQTDNVFWKAKLGDMYINPNQNIAFVCTKQFRKAYPTGNPPETWRQNNTTQWAILELPHIDQSYTFDSPNPQSGIAVAEALSNKIETWEVVHKYEVGDTVIANLLEDDVVTTAIIKCKQSHTSGDMEYPTGRNDFAECWDIIFTISSATTGQVGDDVASDGNFSFNTKSGMYKVKQETGVNITIENKDGSTITTSNRIIPLASDAFVIVSSNIDGKYGEVKFNIISATQELCLSLKRTGYSNKHDDVLKYLNDIPEYWKTHLDEKIKTIRGLQREGGKDCYSFIVLTDFHLGANQCYSPALIKKVAEACNIKYCLCLGDTQSGAATPKKENVLKQWDEINDIFAPIKDFTLMTCGNHDGAFGRLDIDGDTKEDIYYCYNLTSQETYDNIFRSTSLIDGVKFDVTGNGYYVDDVNSKARYIVINSQYASDEKNEDGTNKHLIMRSGKLGQGQFDLVKEALTTIPDDDWTVAIGCHTPICPLGGEGGGGDLGTLRDMLIAYQNRATFNATLNTEGEFDYAVIDVNFENAKGRVIGAFSGHMHNDLSNTEDYPFPILTSCADNHTSYKLIAGAPITGAGEAGTATEQSFDVFTVNKRENKLYATKVGRGTDRLFYLEGADVPDVPIVPTYNNLADPTSGDWYTDSHYLVDGKAMPITDANYSKNVVVTNFIPCQCIKNDDGTFKGDVLRVKGLTMDGVNGSAARLALYDENKVHIASKKLISDANSTDTGRIPITFTDVDGERKDAIKDGVIAYTIMEDANGNQGTYKQNNEKVRYARFSAHYTDTVDDIIITVNEPIV